MLDEFITFLKDEDKIPNMSVYVMLGVILLLIFKSVLKSTKIKPQLFENIILGIFILFLILMVSHVILTKKFDHLLTLVIVLAVMILPKIMPKIVKWYDNKIDELVNKR